MANHPLNTVQPLTRAEIVLLPPTCTFLGCEAKPIRRLSPSTGGVWHGCKKHYPAMVDALYVGMPGATSGGSSVTVTPVKA